MSPPPTHVHAAGGRAFSQEALRGALSAADPPVRIILVHGNGGASVDGNWFPSVRQRLDALGMTVVARNFPDPIKGRARFWLPFLQDEIRPDASSIIVGHSSGSLVALRYAESRPLLGSVHVAGHFTDRGFELERRSGFFDNPFDWAAIRANQRFIAQFHSIDDPWIPVEEARELHRFLASDYVEMDSEGHFGSYNQEKAEFPELIDLIVERLVRLLDPAIVL